MPIGKKARKKLIDIIKERIGDLCCYLPYPGQVYEDLADEIVDKFKLIERKDKTQ